MLSPKQKHKSGPDHKAPVTVASTSVKISSAKSSPAIPLKIPRYLQNPHNKLAETSTFTAPTSGISTKQRLSQLALAPVNPKEAKAKVSHPGISPNPLGALRFQRNSSSGTTLAPDGSNVESSTPKPLELTLNALNASPTNDHPFTSDWAPTMSPVAMEPQDRLHFSPQLLQLVIIHNIVPELQPDTDCGVTRSVMPLKIF